RRPRRQTRDRKKPHLPRRPPSLPLPPPPHPPGAPHPHLTPPPLAPPPPALPPPLSALRPPPPAATAAHSGQWEAASMRAARMRGRAWSSGSLTRAPAARAWPPPPNLPASSAAFTAETPGLLRKLTEVTVPPSRSVTSAAARTDSII